VWREILRKEKEIKNTHCRIGTSGNTQSRRWAAAAGRAYASSLIRKSNNPVLAIGIVMHTQEAVGQYAAF